MQAFPSYEAVCKFRKSITCWVHQVPFQSCPVLLRPIQPTESTSKLNPSFVNSTGLSFHLRIPIKIIKPVGSTAEPVRLWEVSERGLLDGPSASSGLWLPASFWRQPRLSKTSEAPKVTGKAYFSKISDDRIKVVAAAVCYVDGRYHEGDEVVIVQWRRKLGQETYCYILPYLSSNTSMKQFKCI